MRSAAGGTERDVIIGHDWGAIAAYRPGRHARQPVAKAVIMSVLLIAFQARWAAPERGRLLRELRSVAAQLVAILGLQLPWLPERSASGWCRCRGGVMPGYHAEEDLRHVDAADRDVPEGRRRPWDRIAPPCANHLPRGLCRLESVVTEAPKLPGSVPALPRRWLCHIGIHSLDGKGVAHRQ